MTSDLTSWVDQRLDADSKLSDNSKLLILAALEGENALADLAGFTPATPQTPPGEAAEPVGAFLERISVRGFRGIGRAAHLELDPFPSLTVISGRNGSGKSSFAEALEVALTGTTRRWQARAAQWKEQWRNLHEGAQTRIDVVLAEEGVGPTTLTVEWAQDAALDQQTTSLQRRGEKKQAGTTALGWDAPLVTYRPLLTYEELGALLAAEPKVLYDALSTVLGLDQLAAAVTALGSHSKSLSAEGARLAADKKELVTALATLEDERAARARTLLGARTLDVAELRGLATGQAHDNGTGARLRALAALSVPPQDACLAAAEELRLAVGELATVADGVGEALQRRGRLIAAAIETHEHQGDQPCPVCATGTLDAARVAELRRALEGETEQLARLDAARARHRHALDAARALIVAAPGVLAEGSPADGVAVDAAATAWAQWAQAPVEPLGLAEHLTTRAGALRDALDALRGAAQAALEALDEAWSRVASRLAAHADAAESWAQNKPEADAARSALTWLKDNEIVLKNERVQPIADQAQRVWGHLRQESNVELAGLRLVSANTRRHVAIPAQVDGEDAGALSVMSQGELHSLALALFLPRATLPESPFRFVVLDDPVQAMDPSKVDGLVTVLLEIARTRQVIVFSHDDRFASAVRRAPKDVHIKVLEVTRESNSRVTSSVAQSPADRYLGDALAVTKDPALPPATLRRVLPGLLRMALEAQARETYFGRSLSQGESHHLVEQNWLAATRTRARLELAIGNKEKADRWLNAQHRKRALRAANAIHDGFGNQDPLEACYDVRQTVKELREGTP